MGDPFYEAYAARARQGVDQIEALDAGLRRRTGRQAGNALAQGSYDDAASIYFQDGDTRSGTAVLDYGRERAAEEAAQADAIRKQRVAGLGAAYRALRGVPEAERRAAYTTTGKAALTQLGVPADILSAMDAEDFDWTDQSWDIFGNAIGAAEKEYQVFQTPNGGLVAVEKSDPTAEGAIRELRPAGPAAAPNGYRWTAEGALEAIPGGPADPRVVGARAAAGRAPTKGGQARVQGGARPSSGPWSRY